MSVVDTGRDLTRNILATLVMLIVIAPAVWLATSFGKFALFGVIGVIGLAVGIYVGIRHPLWYFWGLAAVMAGFQFGRIPGIGIPIWYLLAFGAIVAVFFHPRFAKSTHPLEIAIWVMYLTALLSLVMTASTMTDISFFVRWSLGVLFVFALCRLAPEHAIRFGKIYVVVAAVNAVYGMFVLAFDSNYTTLGYLRAFGYVPEALFPRVAYTGDSAAMTIRLGGTWVEPNGAAMYLALAFALAMLLFAGWRRIVLVALLSAALVLTLSRASLFTVLAGIVIVLLFHSMRTRTRLTVLGTMAAALLTAFAVEPVRRRILSSFGEGDVGASQRAEALRVFPGQMSGHWGFGWGWGRPEFLDPVYAFNLNLPSNAPLIVLYRSGIVAFIAFVALAIMACVYAYRAVRSNTFSYAMYGGIFFALCLVFMQLDHPLSETPRGALVYAVYLGFLVHVDRARRAELRQQAAEPPAVPASNEVLAASR